MTAVPVVHSRSLPPAGGLAFAPRMWPGAAILGLHAAAVYALYAGLSAPPQPAPRQDIMATLIVPLAAPAPRPDLPKPQPVPQKTVALQPRPALAPVVPVLQSPLPTALAAPPQNASAKTEPVASPVAAVEPAPAAAPPAEPRTISSGVEYVRAPQPEYPSAAKRRGDQGLVVLRVLVNEKGIAEQVEVQKSSGFASMDEAGRKAVLHALFKPYIDKGKATPVYALIPIHFQLDI